ncbi:hypothetical protein ABZT43_35490 [Streptomyces sp. NPDC005349]|uniref:hypothetical protein n=1 Tax=Streptomyces sp. NPDC005349 TaxID=3157037 RepID=UPI0033BBE164
MPNVLVFWIAFVLTEPAAKGGLDLGTSGSSAVLLAVLFGLTQVQEHRTAARPGGEEQDPVTRRADSP